MCGIYGFSKTHHDPKSAHKQLRCMGDSLRHRGPDDDGEFVSNDMAFGMRRLSVIDVDGGKQPVFNERKNLVAVQNGELYNFQDLRSRLQKLGHDFQTNSDTEVIVHLVEEYGADFAEHLNGMFAIAVWDIETQQLVLVRDRLGVKPLYYALVDGTLVFASEIKALLTHPKISQDLDYQALYDYFTLGYIPQPRSVFKDIRKLPPGGRLTFCDGVAEVDTFWQLPPSDAPLDNQATASEQLADLLEDAVRLRMVSDVPLGAFLSGGLDSSIVVALMAQQSNHPIKTFFIDFDNSRYSEREYAQAVASRYGTDHHEFTVQPNAVDILNDVVDHFDEPFGDSSAIPTWYVSKLTREHVTVALSGDGGDESFGGYSRYRRILNRRDLSRVRSCVRPFSSFAANLMSRSVPGMRYVRSLGMSNSEFYSVGTQEHESRCLLSHALLDQTTRSVQEEVNGLAHDLHSGKDQLAPYARFDLRWYLPDDVLTKVDRMSMAHSLEVRSPFLDYRVVELAARMPQEWKLNASDSKLILKKIYSDTLPANVLQPRKRGFSIPLGQWLRNDLREDLLDVLHDKEIERAGLLDMEEARALSQEHMNGTRDRSAQLWRILFFARWYQRKIAVN